MSSTDNATAALYQAVFSANSCGVAVFTILFYDWLLSLGREKRLIWGTDSSKTSASILYFFNRYTIVLNWVLGIITISPVPDKSCTRLYWSLIVCELLAMIGPALFSSLRVHALSGKSKRLAGVTLALGLIPFFVNLSTAYQSRPVNLAPPINCSLDSSTPPSLAFALTLLSRASLIVSDLVVIAVTWATMYRSSRLVRGVVRGPTFHQVMLQNGSIYFVVLVSLNALHITLTALSIKLPLASESYVTTFIDPVTSILISRFLLNLRETSEQPEVQGASSFNADGGYSPELPSFLGSLGPTHSAPEPTERTSGCNNKATYSTAVLSQTQVH